jgi:phosphoglycerate dehydrogenase-like enzyme
MNHVLIVSTDAQSYATLLKPYALTDLTLYVSDTPKVDPSLLSKVNIILGDPPWIAKLLAQAPQLKWVQSTYAGVNTLCQPELRTDYQLTNVKGVFGQLISEYVFGYALALERGLFRARTQQTQHQWQPFAYRSLAGLTMGIAGLGDIGQHLASTAKHFAMQVKGLKFSPATVLYVDSVYTLENLNDFLQDLDYLVITLPSTPLTKHLFNAEALAQLKPDTVLINVGRGACVDQAALTACMQAKKLRAAVLDVFEDEPLAPDDPLWDLEEVYISPHQAAVSFPADVVRIFAQNYQHFQRGESLDYLIDFNKGY